MSTLEEQIAEHLADALANGELRRSAAWGRPIDLDDDFARTPVELRLPFKILRDANMTPPEVAMMGEVQGLVDRLEGCADTAEAAALRCRIADLRLRLALRREHLAASGTL